MGQDDVSHVNAREQVAHVGPVGAGHVCLVSKIYKGRIRPGYMRATSRAKTMAVSRLETDANSGLQCERGARLLKVRLLPTDTPPDCKYLVGVPNREWVSSNDKRYMALFPVSELIFGQNHLQSLGDSLGGEPQQITKVDFRFDVRNSRNSRVEFRCVVMSAGLYRPPFVMAFEREDGRWPVLFEPFPTRSISYNPVDPVIRFERPDVEQRFATSHCGAETSVSEVIRSVELIDIRGTDGGDAGCSRYSLEFGWNKLKHSHPGEVVSIVAIMHDVSPDGERAVVKNIEMDVHWC